MLMHIILIQKNFLCGDFGEHFESNAHDVKMVTLSDMNFDKWFFKFSNVRFL
jgi:hypothetical protein